jgi:hypothetical protein
MKSIKVLAVAVIGVVVVVLALATLGPERQTEAAAQNEIPFAEAELFFELNDTDGDLGIHASIDGDPYSMLEIEDPKGRRILLLRASGRLARKGVTQLFWESAEPSFDELDPEEFFRRFPEGEYEIEGAGFEGDEFGATVELSHVLAAPVGNVMVNTEPAAENCDEDLPMVTEPVTITWDPVTTSHPTIGEPGDVEIDRYQFFVEQGDVKFSADLPPTQTKFQVPSEIFALGDPNEPFKFEIIARTADLNNTAIESCFVVQ